MTEAETGWPVPLPPCLRAERRGAVAIVRLSRPEKRNALSDELVLALTTCFAAMPADIAAVVLDGAGSNFCAGLDLNELRDLGVLEGMRNSVIGQRAHDAIQDCRAPVVAVLHGAVVGAGMEMAASAHIRVAERSAFYALPEGQRGIFVGSGGSVRLTRLIGVARVTDMMLTGRVHSAEDGQAFGLSQYLVETGEGLAKALELAGRIAGNAPFTNFAITQALPRIAEADPRTGLLTESLVTAIAQSGDEAKRRLREFLDGRAARLAEP